MKLSRVAVVSGAHEHARYAPLEAYDALHLELRSVEERLAALEDGGPAEPSTEPTPPPVGLLRHTTYEEDDEQAESAHTSTADGLGTTNEASRLGSRCGYASLRPGDPQWKRTLGWRSEWHGVDAVAPRTERWQGISYLVPPDWHQGRNDRWSDIRIIFQWHATTRVRIVDGAPVGQTSPIYALRLLGSPTERPRFQLYRKDAYVRDGRLRGRVTPLWTSDDLEIGRWYDLAFNTIWSTGSDGRLVAYLDGRAVHRHEGRTLTDRTHVYSKWGIYGQPTRLLFDEIRIAEGAGLLGKVSP